MRRIALVVLAMALVGEVTAPTLAPSSSALDALPWVERVGLEQAIAAIDPRTAPWIDGASPALDGGRTSARFDGEGAHLSIGGAMRAAAIGRAEMRALSIGAPSIADRDVRTDRGGGVTEWWRALESGLEHGLTIAERPSGEGALRIDLALVGMTARGGGDSVDLLDAGGERVATYSNLVVVDAEGVCVPSRLVAHHSSIAVSIDDAAARYPLVVDPLLVIAQEAQLQPPSGTTNDDFSVAVAITADGSRAIVGAPGVFTSSVGHVYVFSRSGTTWTQEALLGSGVSGDGFGHAVSITSDGSRALIGADVSGMYAGGAYVFSRTGTSWTQEAHLLAPAPVANDFFGLAVAISGDGVHSFVGAPGRASGVGAVFVFVRSVSTWTLETTLTAIGGVAGDQLGVGVAVTSDGSRALVGAPGGPTTNGAAYVFYSTGVWMQEARIVAADGMAGDSFGRVVALASDASRALIGAPYRTSRAGVAYVFVRGAPSWTLEAEWAPPLASMSYFASAVAVSADASLALVSGPLSTRTYVRNGTSWSQGPSLGSGLATSLAVTGDRSRAVVGAFASSGNTGSEYVFTIRAADPNGTACTPASATCLSDSCVEGVCCDTACGGGFSATGTNCSSCLASHTGGADGTCAPLSASLAPTITCRPGTGPCDLSIGCSPSSTTCPPAMFAPMGTICHAVPTCYASQCTGTSGACPTALAPAGTMCRPSMGPCDIPEQCDGTTSLCPFDAHIPAGVTCRSPAGSCDLASSCDGATAACAPNPLRPAGTVCMASSGSVCDQDHLCDGTSAACPMTYVSGIVCRPSSGPCDVVESCSGTSANCPPDGVISSGVVCRMSTDPSCDPAEHCDGASTMCPPDTMSCASRPDAGVDAAVLTDAARVSDASADDAAAAGHDAGGSPPMMSGSCGCRAGRSRSRVGVLLVIALGLALTRSRRVRG